MTPTTNKQSLGPASSAGATHSHPTSAVHQTQTQQPTNPTIKSHPSTSTGWASMGSTTAFRALNFELFVKPNKFVMACGVIAFTSCLSYIVYMNLTDDKKKNTYVTLDEDGGLTERQRASRWH